MTPRKPRPDYLTRAEVEAMIAEAVAAEQTRSERAIATVLQAIAHTAEGMEFLIEVAGEMKNTVDRHDAFIEPMATAFATSLAMSGGAKASEGEVSSN